MVYLMLVVGLFVCGYAISALYRKKQKLLLTSPSREMPAAAAMLSADPVFRELKEQVEVGLSVIRKQQDLVADTLFRLEKQLQTIAVCQCGPDRDSGLDDTGRLREEVRLLHSQGATVTQIAGCTGLGKGEVELILRLKN